MKIAIMQPYFLPYIVYWRLINSVDKFVIYDDVQFMKGGWINRNQIYIKGEKKYITLPLKKYQHTDNINKVYIDKSNKLFQSLYNKVEQNYKDSLNFDSVMPLFKEIYQYDTDNLSDYVVHSIKLIMEYLSIETELVLSSNLNKDKSLKAQDKVLDICKLIGAKEYYNLPGGKELYEKKAFEIEDIKLKILDYNPITTEFISILEPMFNSDYQQLKELLRE